MNKIVVYTAIFNDYDWLKDPVVVPKEIDFVCYTDSNKIHSKVWKIVKVDTNGEPPSLKNRKIKLLYPYTELKDYDYSALKEVPKKQSSNSFHAGIELAFSVF